MNNKEIRLNHKINTYGAGVPQGSILGPIIFLIYMNDVQFVTKTIHLLLYADDMNLLCSHKCLKKASAALNKELSSLNEWFQANKLTVNLTKKEVYPFWIPSKNYEYRGWWC